MDRDGMILHPEPPHHTEDGENRCKVFVTFKIHARSANALQSEELIQTCPIQSDDVDAERRMERQTLSLPLPGIQLTVQNSKEHGDTGTYPWRGGLMLSRQNCHWASSDSAEANVSFRSLFRNKVVLELGAGAAGLPSMTLGKISKLLGENITLISSDGVDEIVKALHGQVATNGLDDCIRVMQIDWNDHVAGDQHIRPMATTQKGNLVHIVDTIIFADCIYNEEGASALSQTIFHTLKPGGNVIGVLPAFRVGVCSFEEQVAENHFISTKMSFDIMDENDHFCYSGGGGKDYRLVLWSNVC
ncbi:hypothetical protein ACHAWF_014827 [Thalassiosira exigua]